MNSSKIKLSVQNNGNASQSLTLLLSEEHSKVLEIPFHISLNLSFGSAKHEVIAEPCTEASSLRISAAVSAKWGLSHDDELSIHYNPVSQTVQIGPLIGVMVSLMNRYYASRPFGVNTAFCHELAEECKARGAAVFFFSPDGTNAKNDTIKGWRFTNKWVYSRFPMPNVIYNRITSRRKEIQPRTQKFIKLAKTRHNAIFFNEKYLNKAEVYQALKKKSELRAYLPESYVLKSYQTLKTLAAKYEVVFIKPISGSLGKGIIRVSRGPNQTYTSQYNNVTGIRAETFPNLKSLYNAYAGKIKKTRHQIQRGIRLLAVNGRPVDFRALVQRGETGQWTITSIVARISDNNQFVSNVARGGMITGVKFALARSGSKSAAGGYARLKRAALLVAEGIESHISGHFAELGIDLAIDSMGKVWLIEVNAKPSKDDSAPISAVGKARPSVRKFVQYALYASGFGNYSSVPQSDQVNDYIPSIN